MMGPSVLAVVVMAALIFVPGVALHRIMVPRAGWLTTLGLAPALSAAAVFIFGQLGALAGFAFAPGPFLVVLAVLGLGWWRRASGAPSQLRSRGADPGPGRHRWPARLLLAGLALSSFSLWAGTGDAIAPANRDAAHHGVMAARVVQSETLDVDRIMHDNVDGEEQQSAFYPLAVHGQVALAHRLAGVSVADGLLAATVVFGGLVLPLAMFCLARWLAPRDQLVAGLTAVLVPSLSFFPLTPFAWGSVTIIAGMAMAPTVSIAVAQVLSSASRAAYAVTALAVVGVFGTHSSEVALVGLVAGSLLLGQALRGGGLPLIISAARRGLVLAGMVLLALLPVLGAVLGGAAERTDIDDLPVTVGGAVSDLFDTLLHPGRVGAVVVALALGGAAISVHRRRHTGMLLFGALVAVLYLLSAVGAPGEFVTLPWYQQARRMAFNLVLVLPFFAAVALAAAVDPLRRSFSRRGAGASVTAVAVVGVMIGLYGATNNARSLDRVVDLYAFVDDDAVAAFDYLASVTGEGERVVVDRTYEDGGMWMYAFADVQPLTSLQLSEESASFRERLWLVDHVADFRSDPVVQSLLERYGARYVYINARVSESGIWADRLLSVDALRSAAGVCERFTRGTSHVFELRLSGSCA